MCDSSLIFRFREKHFYVMKYWQKVHLQEFKVEQNWTNWLFTTQTSPWVRSSLLGRGIKRGLENQKCSFGRERKGENMLEMFSSRIIRFLGQGSCWYSTNKKKQKQTSDQFDWAVLSSADADDITTCTVTSLPYSRGSFSLRPKKEIWCLLRTQT